MYEKIIIIGAPRSGTNLLRDLLTELPNVGTWGCDEINYIWRHGNIRYPSDVFVPEMATQGVKSYIRGHFDRYAQRNKLAILVEKTCANSLRVGFVNEVVPDAKYVFIVRDGLDAVGSALIRWKAELDIPYLWKKMRYVPPSDLPFYAMRYFGNRLYRVFSGEKRLASWGPVLDDMKNILRNHPLDEACALQWVACVDHAEKGLNGISSERMLKIKYENFVNSPEGEFEKIADFLGQKVPANFYDRLRTSVSSSSIGKGREQLGAAAIERLSPLMKNTLERYGYTVS